MDLGAPELLIILVVVLVLFGGKKLPDLARSLGSAKREFQEGVNDKDAEKADKADAKADTKADTKADEDKKA